MKALFISDPKDLHSKIEGGVQKCSKEFYALLEACGFFLITIEAQPSKSIVSSVLRRTIFEAYSLYNPHSHIDEVSELIKKNNIKYIFINNAKLLKYSKAIKEKFKDDVTIILLSHGNESGDFLHYINRTSVKRIQIPSLVFRLGYRLYLESKYRIKYIDKVFVLSEQEQKIEQWLGISDPIIIYRTIMEDFIDWTPNLKHIGFIGSLDHLPNYIGIKELIHAMRKAGCVDINIRLVGGPEHVGIKLQEEYNEISYLGKLTEEDFRTEASSWSIFLNPVFYFSRGATTKLSKGISLGLPVLSTIEGSRGYDIDEPKYLFAKDADQMTKFINELLSNTDLLNSYRVKIMSLAKNGTKLDNLVPEVLKNLEIY